jgi:hypothetical protein
VSTASEQNKDLSNDQKWALLMMKAQEQRCADAVTLFRNHGLEPILIKGMAAAAFYPSLKPRLSVDIDLAVSSAEYLKAEAISASTAAAGLAIDVHNELRHMDTVPWQDLFSNSRMLSLAGTQVRVLRPEDHLRVLCIHWLTDGGVDTERLYDIYYHIANRSTDFDWARFLDVVSSRRKRWLECALGLAKRDLGLELGDTPVAGASERLPEWLVKSVDEARARGRDMPIESILSDRTALMEQVKRRFRPNPIYATIQFEGDFDARTRIHYRLGNFFRRIPSSIKRITETISNRAYD